MDYAERIPKNYSGRDEVIEEKLQSEFPPVFDPPQIQPAVPATIVDREGVIIMWYLLQVIAAAQIVPFHLMTVKDGG